jgi:hypothetical protein
MAEVVGHKFGRCQTYSGFMKRRSDSLILLDAFHVYSDPEQLASELADELTLQSLVAVDVRGTGHIGKDTVIRYEKNKQTRTVRYGSFGLQCL